MKNTAMRDILFLILASLTLAGCSGGGGNQTMTNTEPTTQQGTVTEATAEKITIRTGSGIATYSSGNAAVQLNGATASPANLKQGMYVTIGVNSGTALNINCDSELEGVIEQIDASTNSFVVLGQKVIVTNLTVFESGAGFNTLAIGQKVEVYGFSNSIGVITATRIEVKPAGREMSLSGLVANLDSKAMTFTIQTILIDYSTALLPPEPLSNGLKVKVTGTLNADGTLVATKIAIMDLRIKSGKVELEGIVSAFDPVTGTFFVKNRKVQITKDTRFEDSKTAADIANGIMVEVEGWIVAGILIADEIKLDLEISINNNGNPVEIEGIVSDFDPVAGTFFVKNRKVQITKDTRFEDNRTASDIANGVKVEVEGRIVAGILIAQKVKIDFNKEGSDMSI